MAATIAPKLYVTIQYRKDAGNDDGHLGFASPYTKDAAFQKRKSTQDQWAYGGGTSIDIDEEDNVTYSAREGAKVDAASAFIGGWYPQVVKNEPVEGFEIAKSVRRYGWSGSGNVVWRITDPRGYDLEISSDNFASIISCVDMEKGKIKGKCVWGREGAKNVLLPEVSEPFQEALARTKKVNQKVGLKDIQIGDTVDLLTTKTSDDDSIAIYYGKMYFLCVEMGETMVNYGGHYGGSRMHSVFNGVFHLNREVKESYLFKSVKTGQFITLGSPKVSSIVNKLASPMDKHAMALQANAEYQANGKRVGDIYSVILISDTKIDVTKLEMHTVQRDDVTLEDWPLVEDYYSRTYLAQHGGKTYVTHYPGKYDRARDKALVLNEVVVSPNECVIEHIRTFVKGSSYGNGYYNGTRDSYNNNVLEKFDFADVKLFEINMHYGDIVGTVKYLRG
jgi:hypothetical protein